MTSTADIQCTTVKTINLISGVTVHSVQLRKMGGGLQRITVNDGTLIDLDRVRVEVVHYNIDGTLIKIEDYKDNPHQFWIKNNPHH